MCFLYNKTTLYFQEKQKEKVICSQQQKQQLKLTIKYVYSIKHYNIKWTKEKKKKTKTWIY